VGDRRGGGGERGILGSPLFKRTCSRALNQEGFRRARRPLYGRRDARRYESRGLWVAATIRESRMGTKNRGGGEIKMKIKIKREGAEVHGEADAVKEGEATG
jgi:hypothetical protein